MALAVLLGALVVLAVSSAILHTAGVVATLRFLYQQLFSRRVNFLAKTFATAAFFSM